MWKIYVNISCVQLIAYSIIAAQGYVPSSSPQNSNTQMNYGASSNSGLFESQNFQNMAQNVFDPSSDSMDFQEGNFQWQGRSFQLTNQRAFRARFERFLLTSPSEQSDAYQQILQQVSDLLSVGNSLHRRKLPKHGSYFLKLRNSAKMVEIL